MLINEFPFKAVLWDMDGTLIDSEPIWIGEERRIMESLGELGVRKMRSIA